MDNRRPEDCGYKQFPGRLNKKQTLQTERLL